MGRRGSRLVAMRMQLRLAECGDVPIFGSLWASRTRFGGLLELLPLPTATDSCDGDDDMVAGKQVWLPW